MRKKGSLVLIVLAAAMAVVWLYLRPDPAPAVVAGTAPAPRAAAAAAPGRRAAPALAPAPAAPAARAPVPMPSVMKKVFEDSPHLGAYYRLQQKVLPTEDERAALHDMLSDRELIAKIKAELLAPETAYSKQREAKRMIDVELLTDAVSWTDNPEMAAVTGAIEDVMFADNIAAEAPEELAQSLAGDKMELYTQMLHRAPDRAALLAEHAHGKPVEPFLAYSKDWYERNMRGMRADEMH